MIEYHDGLRARFIKTDFFWQQIIIPPDNEPAFYFFDFSTQPETGHKQAIETTAGDLQNKFNLEKGPLFLVALFHLGKDRCSNHRFPLGRAAFEKNQCVTRVGRIKSKELILC